MNKKRKGPLDLLENSSQKERAVFIFGALNYFILSHHSLAF